MLGSTIRTASSIRVTPRAVASPVNTLVLGPGGYGFGIQALHFDFASGCGHMSKAYNRFVTS